MKKRMIRFTVLLAIFVVALVGFSSMMNSEVTENAVDPASPTLPTISMVLQDAVVNRMFGYTQEMDTSCLRDSVTPLGANRSMTIAVKSFGDTISSVSYEIRTVDGSKVVENAKISNFTEDGDYQRADFQVQNAIHLNQEYSLKFTLMVDGREAYYYTRLVQRAGINVGIYLEFVQNFYEKCTNAETAADLQPYLETDNTVTNNSYTAVNIHSSLNQITWGDMKPQIFRKAQPVIKEINETTGSIVLDYMIATENENGTQELYDVTEFYRLSYEQSKIRLLNFERSARQIFGGEASSIATQGISMGIADKDIEYVANDGGDIVAFVQEGELWSYNRGMNKLVKVYSFLNRADTDERDEYLAHDIKIVRVEENGGIDFVVYGYINADVHEGLTGVGIYHYNSSQNVISERAFISIGKSFEFLAQDLDTLTYINKSSQLYIYLDESLYQVDVDGGEVQTVEAGIPRDCFKVSRSQGRAAWMEGNDANKATHVILMDFESGEQQKLTSDMGQSIKALGFINEHFVYGLAETESIIRDASGNVTYPMHIVRIQDFDGTVIKEYQQAGIFVTEVEIQEGLVELNRVQFADGGYQAIESDQIINNMQTVEDSVKVEVHSSSVKGEVVTLAFPTPIANTDPLVAEAKVNLGEKPSNMLELQLSPLGQDMYYVYAMGKLDSIHTQVNKAIQRAYDQVGVVLNDSQQYVWEKGNQADQKAIPLDYLEAPILAMQLDEQKLQEGLGDGYTVLNLTGCSLESVLYEVGQGRAVIAKTSDTESVLIVGYNQFNTRIMSPGDTEYTQVPMDDSEALFAANGNVFLSYIENADAGSGE